VDYKAITGKGVVGVIDKQKITLGNLALMTTNKIDIDDALMQKVTAAQEQGKTVSYIGVNNKALGYVAISDSIKPSSKKAITELMSKGVHVIMMTGDNQNTAKAVASILFVVINAKLPNVIFCLSITPTTPLPVIALKSTT
jgi:Cu2+-exporting ATPase